MLRHFVPSQNAPHVFVLVGRNPDVNLRWCQTLDRLAENNEWVGLCLEALAILGLPD